MPPIVYQVKMSDPKMSLVVECSNPIYITTPKVEELKQALLKAQEVVAIKRVLVDGNRISISTADLRALLEVIGPEVRAGEGARFTFTSADSWPQQELLVLRELRTLLASYVLMNYTKILWDWT